MPVDEQALKAMIEKARQDCIDKGIDPTIRNIQAQGLTPWNIPREREHTVLHSVIPLLAVRGITLWRRNVGAFRVDDRYVRCAEPGQSDLWGTDWPESLPWARHWEIEVKRPGEKPSQAQLEWLRASTAKGCVAFWGDNVDTIVRVAEAILDGGRIIWRDGHIYDVDMP